MPPKMSDDYFAKKRDMILDSALTVCMKKPMHEVTMRDIIAESGLSQGGIYRYYSNLDEIIVELINRESAWRDIKELTDAALSHSVPEKVIDGIFGVWEKSVLDNLIGIGKIYYEICVVYVNNKERLKYFTSNILFAKEEAYLWENLYSFVVRKISEGYFKPKIPLDDIIKFNVVSLDGIIRDLILCKYYQIALPCPGTLEKTRLIKSVCAACILLLGGDEKIIYEENLP